MVGSYGLVENAWFTFYHDVPYRAVKWGSDGKQIVGGVRAWKDKIRFLKFPIRQKIAVSIY